MHTWFLSFFLDLILILIFTHYFYFLVSISISSNFWWLIFDSCQLTGKLNVVNLWFSSKNKYFRKSMRMSNALQMLKIWGLLFCSGTIIVIIIITILLLWALYRSHIDNVILFITIYRYYCFLIDIICHTDNNTDSSVDSNNEMTIMIKFKCSFQFLDALSAAQNLIKSIKIGWVWVIVGHRGTENLSEMELLRILIRF